MAFASTLSDAARLGDSAKQLQSDKIDSRGVYLRFHGGILASLRKMRRLAQDIAIPKGAKWGYFSTIAKAKRQRELAWSR